MSNIFEKLQSARVLLQQKNLKKSGENKFSNFKYFELADFLPQINEIFNNLKLFSCFYIEENQAFLEIFDSEKPADTIVFRMPTAEITLKGCTPIQALGGLNTYCRRYLYLNALEIVESDLLDSVAGKQEEQPKSSYKKNKPAAAIPEETEDNADLDIFAGLEGIGSYKALSQYYSDNYQTVKNKKEFNKKITAMKAEFEKKEAAQKAQLTNKEKQTNA